jgi:hypothetical protein
MENIGSKAVGLSRQYMVIYIFHLMVIIGILHVYLSFSNYVTWLPLQLRSLLLHLESRNLPSIDGILMSLEINHIFRPMK